jgi:uncharacterized protein YmfQ (DUF2313 family)
MDGAGYGRALKKLLPPGVLFRLDTGGYISKTMHAIGDELAWVELRGKALIEETDPRTADETLEDWERVLGLPDEDVTALPTTAAARRLAITQKLIRSGGQNAAYFIELALACGYVATVTDTYGATVARCGVARCGDRMYGPAWAHVWRMNVSPATGTALTTTELEAIIRRAAPAHTVVAFTYL